MSALSAFRDAHAELLAVMGEPATWALAAGGSVAVQALLDRHTAEVGEYGQVVAYRPSIAVRCIDVPGAGRGDIVSFGDGLEWQVIRVADADDMVTRCWVEQAP